MQSIEEKISELDRAISRKDIEPIASIYSSEATLVKQPGEIANGISEITAHYKALFSMGISMTVTTHAVKTVVAGDTAMVTTRWTLEGIDPDGNKGSVEKVANMVFANSHEGGWLLLIDNPFGPEIIPAENA